ncbi:proprotein convertase P-domain-containing protein [Agarivorans sp. QJM3NY_29]|uniref:proprotein convertase P-domain-containing protein n=1 Tax=unclassified Agarivorans TaxID=2636026 RepID=UPI003D7E6187
MKRLIFLVLFGTPLGALGGQWDYPASNNVVLDQQEAKRYVESHYPTIGKLSLRYQSESRLGHQYNFNITLDGEYKPQRTIVVHSDHSGLVQRVFKSLDDTILRDGVASVAGELEHARRLKADAPPALDSGVIVEANIEVVDPDLRTMDRLPAPEQVWQQVSDYPLAPHLVTRQVELLNSGGKYYLSNSRVSEVDAEYLEAQDPQTLEWSQSDSASFFAKEEISQFSQLADIQTLQFASPQFTQLMAFYQLDQSIQYLESLGYNLFSGPIRFDARGLGDNNSSYFMGPKAVMFGLGGGSPDALDADVVVHELGHAIHYHIVPDWGYGHSGAMAEGFADYWAGSNSYRKLYQQGSDFEIDTLFNWDGYFGNKISTRSLWNQRARYFEQSEYRAHESVAGELGDELWSSPLFQTLKQGVELYGEVAFEEVDRLVLESMYGMGRGMKMHDLVESMLYVAKQLYPERVYHTLLQDNFVAHGLVKEPFRIEMDSRYVTPTAPLAIRLFSQGREASVAGRIETSTGVSQRLQSDKFTQLSTELSLTDSATCGESFKLNTQLSYQYDTTLKSLDWSHSSALVFGLPELNQPTRLQQSLIPDATLSDSGALNYGFKSFNFIITDDDALAADELGIYLKLQHSQFSDLEITLVAPSGKRQILMQPTRYSSPSRTFYWVAKHDPIIQAFSAERMAGTWRLELTDYVPENTGYLLEWAVGRVKQYNCTTETDSTGAGDNATNTSSAGGAVSWSSLVIGLVLLWRRHFFQSKSNKRT